MRRRRCLFPADGFYEWKLEGGRRRPYCVRPKDGAPIAFAGLWESWMGPNGEELETAAIVTTVANLELAPLHERMPVIVQPDAFDFWLDGRNVDPTTAAAAIAPAPAGMLEAYEISPAVNRADNDGPELLEPAADATTSAPAEAASSAAQPAPTTGTTRGRRKRDDGQFSLFYFSRLCRSSCWE